MFPNPYKTEHNRPRSPGENARYYAGLARIVVGFLKIRITEGEVEALAVVIGAMIRELPKVKYKNILNVVSLATRMFGKEPK